MRPHPLARLPMTPMQRTVRWLAHRTDGVPLLGRLMRRLDGFYNLNTGMGVTGIDVALETTFIRDSPLPVETLKAAMHYDDLTRRIVEQPVNEALRQGFEAIARKDGKAIPEKSDQVNDRLAELGARAKIAEAAKWGRGLGWGAVLKGTADKDLSKPLKPGTPITHLLVLDRSTVRVTKLYSDLAYPYYSCPKMYDYTPENYALAGEGHQSIHASRLIVFGGALTGRRERAENQHFDHSILQAVWRVLRDNGTLWANVGQLLGQASVGVYKMKGFRETLSTPDGLLQIQQQIEAMKLAMSSFNILTMDLERDEFTRESLTFAGLPDVIDRVLQRIAAAAERPVTVLWGMSPAGMNATGESDTRHWYDVIRAYQENEIRPAVEELVKAIVAGDGNGLSEATEWDVRFPPLWQPTASEEADIRQKVASSDKTWIDAGVLTPAECRTHWRLEGYTTELQVDADAKVPMDELPEPAPDDAENAAEVKPADEEAVDPTTALNGAQVSSLVEVVNLVAVGDLPRETGVAIITACFPLSPEQADKVMGPVGKTFTTTKPTPPPPFGGGPPKPPPAPGAPPDAEQDRRDARGEVVFTAHAGACPTCEGFHGQTYNAGTLAPDVSHPNCLCSMEPVEEQDTAHR